MVEVSLLVSTECLQAHILLLAASLCSLSVQVLSIRSQKADNLRVTWESERLAVFRQRDHFTDLLKVLEGGHRERVDLQVKIKFACCSSCCLMEEHYLHITYA